MSNIKMDYQWIAHIQRQFKSREEPTYLAHSIGEQTFRPLGYKPNESKQKPPVDKQSQRDEQRE